MNEPSSENKPVRANHASSSKKKKIKAQKRRRKILLFSLLGVVLLAALLGLKITSSPKKSAAGEEAEGGSLHIETSIGQLRNEAYALKDNIKLVAEKLMQSDFDGADAAIKAVDGNVATLQENLDSPVWKMATLTPVVGSEVSSVKKLIDIVGNVSDSILKPLAATMRENPFSDIKSELGFNMAPVYPYIDFLVEAAPHLEEICAEMQTLDLDIVDKEGKVSSYTELLATLLDVYHQYEDYFPLIKSVLGADGDRFYMVTAQNSAEIRSTGGFPGAVGPLFIVDHIVLFGEFYTAYDTFQTNTPKSANITDQEFTLFTRALNRTHDTGYMPDFERVASIWAAGTEAKYEDFSDEPVKVDGIISLMPSIIQKFLAVLGEVELSDGFVLTGENATKILQHDIYFKYLGNPMVTDGVILSDQDWTETAKGTFELIKSHMSVDVIMQYLNIFQEGVADRTIMIWMADEQEQAIVREAGWSGALNFDPQKPEAGIFFNLNAPSKLGWFLNLDANITDTIPHDDGSTTYKIDLVLENTITKDDIKAASLYIVGGYEGAMASSLYLFAPAGGTIDNFVSSSGRQLVKTVYDDLELAYFYPFLYPGDRIEITYEVTTAPGVETPLRIVHTPTLQNYR